MMSFTQWSRRAAFSSGLLLASACSAVADGEDSEEGASEQAQSTPTSPTPGLTECQQQLVWIVDCEYDPDLPLGSTTLGPLLEAEILSILRSKWPSITFTLRSLVGRSLAADPARFIRLEIVVEPMPGESSQTACDRFLDKFAARPNNPIIPRVPEAERPYIAMPVVPAARIISAKTAIQQDVLREVFGDACLARWEWNVCSDRRVPPQLRRRLTSG